MSRARPTRTLFLVDRMGYPDGSTHGGTTYFLENLPALHHADTFLTVCFMGRRHPAADKLEAHGVRPIFLNRAKWDPRVILDVARIVRDRDIEVLHLASLRSALVGRWIARLLDRKAVVHLHDAVPLSPLVKLLQRHAARWTNAALILSDAARPYAMHEWGLPEHTLRVLPSGIDTEPFRHPSPDARQRLRREWGIAPDTPLVVLPGRVVPEKGQEDLIRAAPQLLREVPGAAIRIVGKGAAMAHCEALVRQLNLENRIGFTGYRRDMPDVFAAADVIAIPSRCDEPFGFVALEAMAAGRPVVAYRDGGLAELLVDGHTGLFVPRGDLAALAEAIARVLTDPALAAALGAAGSQRAGQFTPEIHAARLLEVYEHARSSGPRIRVTAPTAGASLCARAATPAHHHRHPAEATHP